MRRVWVCLFCLFCGLSNLLRNPSYIKTNDKTTQWLSETFLSLNPVSFTSICLMEKMCMYLCAFSILGVFVYWLINTTAHLHLVMFKSSLQRHMSKGYHGQSLRLHYSAKNNPSSSSAACCQAFLFIHHFLSSSTG